MTRRPARASILVNGIALGLLSLGLVLGIGIPGQGPGLQDGSVRDGSVQAAPRPQLPQGGRLEAAERQPLTLGQPLAQPTVPTSPDIWTVKVLEGRHHEADAFTQGLLLFEGALYESTGLYGESSLRKLDPKTGAIQRQIDLEPEYFAEGLARVDDRLIQITWKEGKAFIYKLSNFESLGSFDYSGEGWGLCLDDAGPGPRRLIMSDGSDTLTYRNPSTFEITGHVQVTAAGSPVTRLNELECVGQTVYANLWTTTVIVRVDKDSGVASAIVDASGLLTPEETQGADVLNGIAYDPATRHFLITGKRWPKLFEIQFEGVGADNPGGVAPTPAVTRTPTAATPTGTPTAVPAPPIYLPKVVDRR